MWLTAAVTAVSAAACGGAPPSQQAEKRLRDWFAATERYAQQLHELDEADYIAIWPTAEIAVMGPKGAVEIIFREEKSNRDKIAAREREYREKFANPFVAAERGYIDEVIEPRDTRRRLIQALEVLHTKRDSNPPKKHGNIPL